MEFYEIVEPLRGLAASTAASATTSGVTAATTSGVTAATTSAVAAWDDLVDGVDWNAGGNWNGAASVDGAAVVATASAATVGTASAARVAAASAARVATASAAVVATTSAAGVTASTSAVGTWDESVDGVNWDAGRDGGGVASLDGAAAVVATASTAWSGFGSWGSQNGLQKRQLLDFFFYQHYKPLLTYSAK